MSANQPKSLTARTPLVAGIALAAVLSVATPMWSAAHETGKPAAAQPMDHKAMSGSEMAGMSMTGDVDYDFAANMRMHHQRAVDNSEAELSNGKNPQLLRMAQEIITAQKKEIAVLDKWLADHKASGSSPMPMSK